MAGSSDDAALDITAALADMVYGLRNLDHHAKYVATTAILHAATVRGWTAFGDLRDLLPEGHRANFDAVVKNMRAGSPSDD